jgi:flagellar biosynthesis anti-sigma factor FlgM
MKINDSNVHINFEAYAQRSKDAAGNQGQPTKDIDDNASVDKVVLSPKAREIQEARKQLEDIPDIDETRVSRISLQLETGVYKIDGRQIADKMMQEMAFNMQL